MKNGAMAHRATANLFNSKNTDCTSRRQHFVEANVEVPIIQINNPQLCNARRQAKRIVHCISIRLFGILAADVYNVYGCIFLNFCIRSSLYRFNAVFCWLILWTVSHCRRWVNSTPQLEYAQTVGLPETSCIWLELLFPQLECQTLMRQRPETMMIAS